MSKRTAWSRPHGQPEKLCERLPGQIILLFALFSVVLIGFLALAIDAGYLMSKRRELQNAADAAALAAAVAAMNDADTALTEETALAYAMLNADVGADDVTVSIPPTSGPNAGDGDFVQVTIESDVTKFFLGVIYTGDWKVGATATAGILTQGYSTGLLALNSNAGGITMSGYSRITVNGASVISNYNLNTSGNSGITATGHIMANDGHIMSGSWYPNAGEGENYNAPEIPDPLLELIDPPTLPSFIGNTVPTVPAYAESTACTSEPAWHPLPTGAGDPALTREPAQYSGSCSVINAAPEHTYRFVPGEYRYISGASVSIQREKTRIEGGAWNFVSGGGINVTGGGSMNMCAGDYSFLGGAGLSISGYAPNATVGGGSGCTGYGPSNVYFEGGSGLTGSGTNGITIYPGTYIFNGGTGLNMSGDAELIFQPGEYEFWFNAGADMTFSGSSTIVTVGDVYVTMHFYGSGGNPANLQMSGNTSFNVPSGEYYFKNGQMRNSGSAYIYGEDVFLYFTDGGYLHSSGSADFSFTAPDWMVYPGYYPGVFMYSDRSNTATFQWSGRSNNESEGVVYLPSSPLQMSGASNAKVFTGQMIVDRIITSGNMVLQVDYEEYVSFEIPAVYLVN